VHLLRGEVRRDARTRALRLVLPPGARAQQLHHRVGERSRLLLGKLQRLFPPLALPRHERPVACRRHDHPLPRRDPRHAALHAPPAAARGAAARDKAAARARAAVGPRAVPQARVRPLATRPILYRRQPVPASARPLSTRRGARLVRLVQGKVPSPAGTCLGARSAPKRPPTRQGRDAQGAGGRRAGGRTLRRRAKS